MSPRRTPLSAEHEAAGAQMVEFFGWWLPVAYGSILDEVRTVRSAAGLFDLCHMGRLRVTGGGAAALVARLVTCDVDSLQPGAIRYGLLTREDGTILDDVLVYREPESFFLCVNASNKNRDVAWLRAHAAGTDATIEDLTNDLAMIAVQGPAALDVLRPVLAGDVGGLANYSFTTTRTRDPSAPGGGIEVMVSRTGYTGEDGFELYLPAAAAAPLWRRLLDAGRAAGVRPIGLGARDTLRLEAGMPLYGHELDDATTPVEAGLGWAVRKAGDFVGAAAIRDLQAQGTSRRLVGFVSDGRRVPRQGQPIYTEERQVGQVCSGTVSPTVGRNIGTAFVVKELAETGTNLSLDLRGERVAIEIVPLPFYRRRRDQGVTRA